MPTSQILRPLFFDLHLSISGGFVKSKIHKRRVDFDFDIVHFPLLDGDIPRSTSYGVYTSQLVRFARVSCQNFPDVSKDNNSDVFEAFSSTARYLNDLLKMDTNFFDSMVNHIYASDLQLNNANVSDTEASFFYLHLSISGGFVKTKIHKRRVDFDFDIVHFPLLDGDIPRSTSYGVYTSQLVRFARVSCQNFPDAYIDIIKFVRRFQSFIGGILT